MNPLLQNFETAPFSKIKNEHFKPAILKSIDLARKEIDLIASSNEEATFENTIEALEFSGKELDLITSIFFNLNSAETNDEIQKIAQEISPVLSEFKNDIILNESLFQRVKTIYTKKDSLQLSVEQNMLLEKKYKAFSRNGANLSSEKKQELREIDKELSSLSLKFGENVLAETNRYELQILNETDLSGLPADVIEEAKEVAAFRKKEGWIFTLDYPSYIPFMKYARNRELRKQMAVAFGSRGFHGDELDNQEIVLKTARLRYQRANLLGYPSHAAFVLEERMAETAQKVQDFLSRLLEKAKPAALREFRELEDFAREMDKIDRLEKWDSGYYGEKLKQKLFDLDDEKC
jgi:oligopeptidase A